MYVHAQQRHIMLVILSQNECHDHNIFYIWSWYDISIDLGFSS